MKYIGLGVGVVLVIVLGFGAVLYGMKWFNSATSIERTVQADENVKCFVVATTDGVSTDCWKVD